MWNVLRVLQYPERFPHWKQSPPWVEASYLEVASLRGSFRSRLSVERTGVLSFRDC